MSNWNTNGQNKDSSTQTDFSVSKQEVATRFYNHRYLKHEYNTIDKKSYLRRYTYTIMKTISI